MTIHPSRSSCRGILYLAGLLLGTVFLISKLSLAFIVGNGQYWQFAGGDVAVNLSGHLAYQASPWAWPLLWTPTFFVPHGLSIAMTDSNPLVSIAAKLIAGFAGHPVNLLGYWVALCFLLQPVAAIYAMRGFAVKRPETAFAGAIAAICFPAFLARFGHINLLGHFYLLHAARCCHCRHTP
jgi:hypothetical protein